MTDENDPYALVRNHYAAIVDMVKFGDTYGGCKRIEQAEAEILAAVKPKGVNPEELRGLLKGEFAQINICFNDHASNYETAAQWWANADEHARDFADWVSGEERDKALALNSVWLVQVYPNNPNGFVAYWASSFDAAAKAALSEGEG